MSNKLNKWKNVGGKLILNEEGLPTMDLITSSLKGATASIINPVVDTLAMQDKAYAEAEFNNLSMNIDRQRINRFNAYLNEKMDDIATKAIEAGKKVEELQVALEAEVIDIEAVEVKSFADVFASKLGGALTINSNSSSDKKMPPGKSMFSDLTK
jgi:hypothetical protein